MSGFGNLYPNWLGTGSVSLPNNTITTTTNVGTLLGISTITTPVNVVPLILQSYISTAQLNTNNPSEMLAYTVPTAGWYKTEYNGVAFHAGGGVADWSNFTQLDWFVKKNNANQSNTILLVNPQFISGDSVSELISVNGGGVFHADAGDLLEWTVDGNATPAITSNYFAGFSFITLQKIA